MKPKTIYESFKDLEKRVVKIEDKVFEKGDKKNYYEMKTENYLMNIKEKRNVSV